MNYQDFKQTAAFRQIANSLIRERNQKLAVGIVSIILGILLTARLNFQKNEWILGVLALSFLVGGLLIIDNLIKNWQLEKLQLVNLLKNNPKEIVWIYSIQTNRLPFGIQFTYDCTMYFYLLNRDFITVDLPKQKVIETSETLNLYLKHATFGYSEDNEQWYLANPELLLK
jgi:general stress protein CsbA